MVWKPWGITTLAKDCLEEKLFCSICMHILDYVGNFVIQKIFCCERTTVTIIVRAERLTSSSTSDQLVQGLCSSRDLLLINDSLKLLSVNIETIYYVNVYLFGLTCIDNLLGLLCWTTLSFCRLPPLTLLYTNSAYRPCLYPYVSSSINTLKTPPPFSISLTNRFIPSELMDWPSSVLQLSTLFCWLLLSTSKAGCSNGCSKCTSPAILIWIWLVPLITPTYQSVKIICSELTQICIWLCHQIDDLIFFRFHFTSLQNLGLKFVVICSWTTHTIVAPLITRLFLCTTLQCTDLLFIAQYHSLHTAPSRQLYNSRWHHYTRHIKLFHKAPCSSFQSLL